MNPNCRNGNNGILRVSGQPQVSGTDNFSFSLLNLENNHRFVIFLGRLLVNYTIVVVYSTITTMNPSMQTHVQGT